MQVIPGMPRPLLLCEVDGTREEVASSSARVAALFRELGATSIVVSADEAQRTLCGRAANALFRPWGDWRRITTAWTAPFRAARCPACSLRFTACLRHYGLPVANVFHAGDGNLHPLILFDASEQRCRCAGRNSLARISLRCRCRLAAALPASTAWDWKNCAR